MNLTPGSKSILYSLGYVLGIGTLILTGYAILLGVWVTFVMATMWALQ